MPKRDTLTLLDELEELGLRDSLFRDKLHHLGGTLNEFRAFCERVGFFLKSRRNQLLHDRLEYILTQCRKGALKSGRSMEDLVEEAKRNVRCEAYSSCKKHISDDSCTKHER